MTLRIGVIGTGLIGQDHIRRITQVLSGGGIVALSDIDQIRAAKLARDLPGARVYASGTELIAARDVDAVMVTSSGDTHESYVLLAIAAGKPVFCEKPLATTQAACERIIDAEAATGKRLVQVGFMRRYDDAYRALKRDFAAGMVGNALLVHCAHRNPKVPDSYLTEMAIHDTAIHEIDVMRWLLGEEIASVSVHRPRRNARGAAHLHDPLFMLFESTSGTLIDVETSVNIEYGYDIRCEIVGETGTLALGESPPVALRSGMALRTRIPADWRERFLRAYDVEIQEWINDVAAGRAPTGPNAWDGYAASVVTDSGVQALRTGERVAVKLRAQPKLYQTGGSA